MNTASQVAIEPQETDADISLQTKFKFIHFEYGGRSKSGKTFIYFCYNSENKTFLGRVSYYAGWYKYVFEPDNSLKLIFENQCLKDIATFLEELNKLQRKISRSKVDKKIT
jgi:hypothetical protein